MRSIAVILNDNDFSNTVRPLLETVHMAYKQRPDAIIMLPETVEEGIRAGLCAHYILFQYRPTDSGLVEHVDQRMDYLNDRIKILFDDEAEHDWNNCDHGGGAWFMYLKSGNIHSY